MSERNQIQGFDLVGAARRTMLENGFSADFPPEVTHEVAALHGGVETAPGIRDLRRLFWSSIDNDESKDLDQIEVALGSEGGVTTLLVGVADVDHLVSNGSATDRHAGENTTSVYTGVVVFPMLPERLSTDLTSLNEGVDRLAVVIELAVDEEGAVVGSDVYRALVRNRAKLAYNPVGAWLEGSAPAPPKVAESPELQHQLRTQDRVAQALKGRRHERGALELETIEARPVAEGGKVVDLELTHKTRARELIEDFMIAANGAMARFLEQHRVSSIRRVVKAPERWERLVMLAAGLGEKLPEAPSSVALASFLSRRKAADPDRFADLSLSVVKLMGPGEYALERAGQEHDGHFGLAVQDYTHSTAPNRRYADLITQRLVKAAIAKRATPYTDDVLEEIARHATERENGAKRVERQMRKVAAALFLSGRIGEQFDAIITGASPKGTFARLIHPPAEGRIVRGEEGLDVGDRVRLTLVDTSPSRGFIDFARA